MKRLVLLSLFTILTINGISQEIKKDTRSQLLKEDDVNQYHSEKISSLDIVQAMEFAGIRIFKFYLGEFDKKYNFILTIDEYVANQLVKTDTILDDDNEYHYYEESSEIYFLNYIDQIKIFTKEEENKLSFSIYTYKQNFKHVLSVEKTDENQFFNLRSYTNTIWQLNKKIPMLIFASSWKDKKYGFQRFCEAVNLVENDKDTEELLSFSPHYFLLSYTVSEVDNE